MKFFQALLIMIAYCVGVAHGLSYVVRIGKPRGPPVLPGQTWRLPGVGDIMILRSEDSYVYYEKVIDFDQVWCCRTKTFKDHATLVEGGVMPSPVFHLIDPNNSNVIQLKKDTSNDSV